MLVCGVQRAGGMDDGQTGKGKQKKQIGEGEVDGWGCDGSKLTIHKLYLPG